MAGGLAGNSPARLFEIPRKGKIRGETKMAGCVQCGQEWISRHLLADLPAPQDDKLEAS